MTEKEVQLKALLEANPTIDFTIVGKSDITQLTICKSNRVIHRSREGSLEQAMNSLIKFLETPQRNG